MYLNPPDPVIRKKSLLTLLLFAARLAAQPAVELEKIGIEDGLLQGFISAIYQDREAFLWFGTNNGLNRYDGYEFTVFRHDPYDPHSLAHDEVVSITEFGEFLCVLTFSGLDFFDKQTRRFDPLSRQFLPFPFANRVSDMVVLRSLSDPDGDVWTAGLEYYQPGRGVLVHYRPADDGSELFYFSKPLDKKIGAIAIHAKAAGPRR